MTTQPRRFWPRVLKEIQTGDPVTVYERDIRDYAGDIANAQRRVTIAKEQLAAAKQQLSDASAAFIEHCRTLDIPIEMEPTQWPKRPYELEE